MSDAQASNDRETEDGPTFDELVERLGQPLPAHWVRWRLMQRPREGQTRGLAVAYVSMTDVEDFLDEVMTPARWRCNYPMIGQFVVCRIELQDDEGKWIGKEDGAGDNVDRDAQNASDDDLDKDTKAVLSDAFKRAARRWGIGRYLAKLEKPWVDCEQRGRSHVIAAHEYPRLAELAGAQPGTYVPPPAQPAPQPAPQPAQQQQAPTYQNAQPPQYTQPAQHPAQYAQQQQRQQSGGQAPPRQGGGYGGQGGSPKKLTIPGGREKGVSLQEASEESILYWINAKSQNSDPKYARSNQEWVAAADAELARRNGGGSGGHPAQSDKLSSNRRGNRPPPAQSNYQGPPPEDDGFGYQPPANGYNPSNDDIPF